MTLKQFFAKARRGRKWKVTAGGDVRCANGFCPLGAVMRARYTGGGGWRYTPAPRAAADQLSMRYATAARIAGAADFPTDPNRMWLLKNLGVSVPHTHKEPPSE